MHFSRWLPCALYALLGFGAQFGAAFPGSKPAMPYSLLSPRQFPDLPPDVIVDENCRAMCEPGTCSICPNRRGLAWSSRRGPALPPDYSFNNGNDTNDKPTLAHLLGKRAFSVQVNNAGEAADYIKRQFEMVGNPDPQFGTDVAGFFSGGPLGPITTVSYESRLASNVQRFQWGTGGLHGCTMMLLVSRRAAWMAHFWEVGAFCGHDDFLTHKVEDPDFPGETIRCQENWDNEVRDVILGAARPSVPSVPISFDLYNQPGDNTQLIFMTPAKDGASRRPRALYPRKINELTKMIKAEIPGIQAIMHKYPALNYDPESTAEILPGSQAWLAANSERGHALFQWDGATNWRVLYEAFYEKNY